MLRLAQCGNLHSVRVGSERRYPESAIVEFLERNVDVTARQVSVPPRGREPVTTTNRQSRTVSIRKNKNAYQVRVYGFRSVTVPTRKAAEKVELDLKLRRSLGELYDEAETTLGEEIDGFLAWKRAAAALSDAGYRHLEWSSKIWAPFRDTPTSQLRRVEIEDHITTRAASHRRSAKNELVFLKAVLRRASGRGQRVDERILAIDPIRHFAREGIALTPISSTCSRASCPRGCAGSCCSAARSAPARASSTRSPRISST